MKKLFSPVVLSSIFHILFFGTAFGQIPATINAAGTWSASTGSGSVTFAAGNCYTVTVEAWGGGGGGGGASGDGASGGGTGGGFAQGAVTISGGSVCFYSVGTGGTAGTTAGTNGGPGGPTWFNGTPGTNNNTTGSFINGGGGVGGNGITTNVGAAAQTTVGAGTFGTPGITDTASHSGGTGGGGFVSGSGDGGGGGGGGGAGTGGNGGNGATTIVGGTGAFGCPNGGGGGGGGGGGATGAGIDGNPGNNNGGGGTGGAANGGGTGGTANANAAGLGGTGTAGGPGNPLGGGGGAGNGCCGCNGGAGGDGAAGSGSIGGGGGGGTGDGGGGSGGNGGAHGGGGAGADGGSSAAGGTGGAGYLTITVALVPPPTAIAGPALAAICQGATTTVMNGSVSAGATALWTGGAGTWTNPTDPINATYTAGAAETGTITLTLTATSPCGTGTDTKTLTINPSPAAPTVTSPVTYCQNTAAVALTATGTGSLLWYTVATGGIGSGTAPTPLTTATGQTTYYVSQTVNGCESARDSIVVIVNALPTPTFTATSPVCVGQSSTITYTGNAPANATYVWGFQGGTPPTQSGQGPFSITFASPGPALVGVSVTENGCSSDTDFAITVNPLPTSTFTATTPVCVGQNATITYTGNATGAATYTWGFSGGTVVTGAGQGPYTVNWPASGNENITLSVTENGCSSTTTTVPVAVNSIPTSTFMVTTPVCAFQNSAIVYTGNATAGATYTWNFAGGTVASGTGQGPYQVNWPTSGNENVTLSVTQNGCTSILTTVPVTVNPTSTATFSVTSPVCVGQNSTITYTGTGTGAGTYTWGFAGGTVVSGAGQGPYQVNWATGGTENITLSVTENGCSDTSSNNVLVVPIPTSTFTGPVTACAGQPATFTYTGNAPASATYNWGALGGTPVTFNAQGPYNVTWPAASNAGVALYVVNNGCVSDTTILPVTVNATPVSNAGPDIHFCSGASDSIGSLPVVGYTYSWFPTTGLGSATVSDPTITLTNNTISNIVTNYIVTTSAADNCSSTDTVVVTVFPALVLSAPVIKDVSCYGNSDGCITVVASGGASPYAYIWSNGSSNTQICNLPIGLYNVTVADINGCTDSVDNIAVTQPDSLTIATTVSPASCPGQSDGSIQANLTGGTQPYTYAWSNNAGNINPDASLTVGNYSLTVTDANNCTITATDTIVSLPALALGVAVQNVLCVPLNDGSITITPSTNFPPATYVWSNGLGTQTVTGLPVGAYSVTVTDAHNCTGDTTVNIITDAQYGIVALPHDTTIDLGGQVYISVSANGVGGGISGALWNPSYGLSCNDCTSPVASPGQSTMYVVTITSDSGCVALDTVNIQVIPIHDVYVPNVFAPTGTGVNDVLQVFGNKEAWKYFEISIFDRWGEKVYDSRDMNFNWDGSYKGKPLPMGVYVYEMHVVYLDNFTDKNYHGSITLLR